MATPVVPPGYTKARQLTLTGQTGTGAATSNGSTSAPTTSSTDWVTTLAITGATATAIWNALSDTSAFTDFAIFWNNGTSWVQIDVDIDQDTKGAWSSTNIYCKFKLQENLAASGTSTNYMLAYGKQSGLSITTMNTLTNIYNVYDDFPGTSLSGSWTTNIPTGGAISVASSVVTITANNSATIGVYAQYTSPTFLQYALSAKVKLPGGLAGGQGAEVGWRVGNTGNPTHTIGGNSAAASPTNVNLHGQAASTSFTSMGVAIDTTAYHVLMVARDSTGNESGSYDGGTVTAGTNPSSTATNLNLRSANTSGASGGNISMLVDWVKVRPWLTTSTAVEPTVAVGSAIVNQQTLSAVQSAVLTMVRRTTKLLSAAQSQVATLTKTITKVSKTVQSGVPTLSTNVIRAVTISAVQTQVVSMARQTTKLLSAAQSQTASLAKQTTKVLTLAQTPVITMTRLIGKAFSAAQSQVVTTARQVGKSLVLAQSGALTLSKVTSKVVTVAQAPLLALTATRVRVVLLTLAQSAAVSLTRQTAKALTVAQAGTLSLGKRVGKAFSVAQAPLLTQTATKARVILLALAQSGAVTMTRQTGKALAIAQTGALSLTRGVGKALTVAQSASVSLTRQIGKALVVSQVSALSSARTIGKVFAVAQAPLDALQLTQRTRATVARLATTIHAMQLAWVVPRRQLRFVAHARRLAYRVAGALSQGEDMQLIPVDPTADPPYLASTEKNITFTADFTADLGVGESIVSAAAVVWAYPTGTPLHDDVLVPANAVNVTGTLLIQCSVSGAVISVELDNHNAVPGTTYLVLVTGSTATRDVTHNFEPIPCTA